MRALIFEYNFCSFRWRHWTCSRIFATTLSLWNRPSFFSSIREIYLRRKSSRRILEIILLFLIIMGWTLTMMLVRKFIYCLFHFIKTIYLTRNLVNVTRNVFSDIPNLWLHSHSVFDKTLCLLKECSFLILFFLS